MEKSGTVGSRRKPEKHNSKNSRKKNKLSTGNDSKSGSKRSSEVVEKICDYIRRARVFPRLHPGLLKRAALFEASYPKSEGTRPEGGVWRLTRAGFLDTQDIYAHPELQEYFVKIYRSFKLNWTKVSWDDLKKPLVSALAAGLLIAICSHGVKCNTSSSDLAEQALLWQHFYHSSMQRDPNSLH